MVTESSAFVVQTKFIIPCMDFETATPVIVMELGLYHCATQPSIITRNREKGERKVAICMVCTQCMV